jgi:uncharacterized cupredoxin-like copper-binding protein
VFALAVLVTLGLVGLNSLMVLLMQLQPGFLGMAHFTELHHRTHDLTFGFLFVPAVVGMLAQLHAPSRNIAGQLMALIPVIGLVLTLVLTSVLANNTNVLNLAWVGPAAMTLISALLHPAGRDLFRSFSIARANWLMLALVAIASVPLLAFASSNIGLQGNVLDDHARMGHYGFMAAFSFSVIGVGLLASLWPDGWRLTAWVAGLLPALLGLASVMYPDASSSLGLVWALAAIAWGATFVAAAELTQGAESPKLPALGGGIAKDDIRVGPNLGSTPSTPRWVQVFGIIVIVLVLAFGIMHLTGNRLAGPGMHTPPGGAGGHAPPSSGREYAGGIGGPVDADEATRTVEVATLDNMTFEPGRINVSAGETVTFLVTNTGQTVHEFTLGDAAMQQEHADEMAQMGDGMAHDGPNSITLQPGETKQLTWRFGDTGTLEYGCHIPGHYQAGMRGQITITEGDI